MALTVIGTGFGRTGTNSMREALTMLGFGPCHHMFEINKNDEQRQMWRALAKGGARLGKAICQLPILRRLAVRVLLAAVDRGVPRSQGHTHLPIPGKLVGKF